MPTLLSCHSSGHVRNCSPTSVCEWVLHEYGTDLGGLTIYADFDQTVGIPVGN